MTPEHNNNINEDIDKSLNYIGFDGNEKHKHHHHHPEGNGGFGMVHIGIFIFHIQLLEGQQFLAFLHEGLDDGDAGEALLGKVA